MESAVLYDHLQFAFTATFHYLFPQLTMGRNWRRSLVPMRQSHESKNPPSPRLSACITTQRYLTVTTRKRAQIRRDRMPKIVAGAVVSPTAGLNHPRNA